MANILVDTLYASNPHPDNNLPITTRTTKDIDNQKIVDLLIQKATSEMHFEGTVKQETSEEIRRAHNTTQTLLKILVSDAIGRDFKDY